jgi:hypothetical protein
MSKYELTKSVEARKLSKRTGQPTNDPPSTIPYGAILEKVEFSGDSVRFVYLVEHYQAKAEHVKGALVALGGGPVELPVPAASAVAAELPVTVAEGKVEAPAEPARLRFEKLSSNIALYRAAIPGGWLIANAAGAATFVPDADHSWDGSSMQ